MSSVVDALNPSSGSSNMVWFGLVRVQTSRVPHVLAIAHAVDDALKKSGVHSVSAWRPNCGGLRGVSHNSLSAASHQFSRELTDSLHYGSPRALARTRDAAAGNTAVASPELAVLSAMAHGRDEVEIAVKVAFAALSAVTHLGDSDHSMLYNDLIHAALSDAARKALQMIPEGYQFQSRIIRESMEKGRAEGQAFGTALSVLEVFEAREIPVSEDQRSRILASTDLEQLSHWLKRAITAASVDELFTQ